jgi:hypothetical protein
LELDREGRLILKLVIKDPREVCNLDESGLGHSLVACPCECGNEPSGYTEGKELSSLATVSLVRSIFLHGITYLQRNVV